ncbi:FecR domain-containing protein [Chitinophaga horti]|uniref:FecR domain-containing protein n=1 Tax=Chitinophaga horti TaxID=2920382 RepID=A0ABY6J4H3_9BACT|nr:FecR family protein [Chitinophaga horti]UYQ94527.1 FecR domain-containing protein [Chitinophaga horti]
MSTPRGGQFRATLPDGSKVWLNAASSITYPTAFGDKERRVQVKGEVYIEVAENAQLPFFLNASPVEIAVLGTAFNVSAYEDETHITTTLVSGSIAVNAGGRATPVKPGQQAAYANDVFQLNEQADVEQATAWKKGVFYFKDAGLDVVLRELARWYDVQVVYEGVVPRRSFRGEIGRDLSLQQVLKGLGDMGVKFRIEDGRRLVVTP